MKCICVSDNFRHSVKSNKVPSITHILHIWSRTLCVRRCWVNKLPACKLAQSTLKWMRRLGITSRRRSKLLNNRLSTLLSNRLSIYSNSSSSSNRLSKSNSSNSNRSYNSRLHNSSVRSKRKRNNNHNSSSSNSSRLCNRLLNSICSSDSRALILHLCAV